MRAPVITSAASALLGLEALAVLVITVREIAGFAAGEAAEPATALALIVLTLLGAVALASFSVGVARGRSWARSGGVVFHVLGLALVLASLMLRPIPWGFSVAVGIPGIIGLILLISSARIEGPGRVAGDEVDDDPQDRPTRE